MCTAKFILPLAVALFRQHALAPCEAPKGLDPNKATGWNKEVTFTFHACHVVDRGLLQDLEEIVARDRGFTSWDLKVHFEGCSFGPGALLAGPQTSFVSVSDCVEPLQASHLTPWGFADADEPVRAAFQHADEGLLDEKNMLNIVSSHFDPPPRELATWTGRTLRIANCPIKDAGRFFRALWPRLQAESNRGRLVLAGMDVPMPQLRAAIASMPPYCQLGLSSLPHRPLVLTETDAQPLPASINIITPYIVTVYSGHRTTWHEGKLIDTEDHPLQHIQQCLRPQLLGAVPITRMVESRLDGVGAVEGWGWAARYSLELRTEKVACALEPGDHKRLRDLIASGGDGGSNEADIGVKLLSYEFGVTLYN